MGRAPGQRWWDPHETQLSFVAPVTAGDDGPAFDAGNQLAEDRAVCLETLENVEAQQGPAGEARSVTLDHCRRDDAHARSRFSPVAF